jgi:hypothetical protein
LAWPGALDSIYRAIDDKKMLNFEGQIIGYEFVMILRIVLDLNR